MRRLFVGTGLPDVDCLLGALPCEVAAVAHCREDITLCLTALPASALPEVLVTGDALRGEPEGIDFAVLLRARWPHMRVVWLATEGRSEADSLQLSQAGVAVLSGDVSTSRLAELLGLPQMVPPADSPATDRSAASLPPVSLPVPVRGPGLLQPSPVAMPDGYGTLVAVWSPKSEGATVVALHLAQVAVETTPTVLLDLNLRRPALHDCFRGCPPGAESLDSLWPMLEVGSMTPEYLDQVVSRPGKSKGPAVLMGTRYPEYCATYGLEAVVNLVQAAVKGFPLVVVDVGADLDNAGTEAVLTHADAVVVVLRANFLSMSAYRKAREILKRLRIDLTTHQLLITGHRTDSPYQPKDVADFCEAPVAGTLPFVAELDVALSLGEYLDPDVRSAAEFWRALRRLNGSFLRV